jgi:acyl dehydratase
MVDFKNETGSYPVFPGRKYRDLRVGEIFHDSVTVTEAHLVLACGIFKDFNPLHSNQTFGERTTFKGRIMHGPFTSAVMAGLIGNYFTDTIIALEQKVIFKAPVRPGDTLTTSWQVVKKEDKEKIDGGVVYLEGECVNQEGTIIALGEARAMIGNG